MDENKKKDDKPRRGGANWKPAIEIFIQVSTWIIGPIVLALIFGKMLDVRYGTTPWIFITLTGLAFLISSFGIVRVVSKYIQDINPPSHKATKDKEKK